MYYIRTTIYYIFSIYLVGFLLTGFFVFLRDSSFHTRSDSARLSLSIMSGIEWPFSLIKIIFSRK